ncbi:MAG TPA: tannase/feruloyl esterase family alpha/beta hydrolase [Vicinamibacterales bacterium]|nr:tannase/feruloyl esterase family alpha/beta hydrolase [Vicinamibacterales bacterium]
MRRRVSSAAATAALAALTIALISGRDAIASGNADACERLRDLALPTASVTAAQALPANAAPFHASRPFCRVQLTIAPTRDSDIKAEVWLPTQNWNGKYEAVGNADAAGVISYGAMREALARGYATSSTDTGHVGNTMAFAIDHHEKYVDFGYRAVHEMTTRAKTIVEAFYRARPAHSYWNGCSQGGRQGVTEAIRYPADYDGIVAGAPAIDYMHLHAARLALNRFVHRSAESAIPSAKFPAIHRAALAACDTGDGVADGLIADPSRCHFDPIVIECQHGDAASCLTATQVDTARSMYAPVIDPATGRLVEPALLQPGSELGWSRLAGDAPLINSVDAFRYVVFRNAKWDWRGFRLSSDLPVALETDAGVIDRTEPNLRPFFDAGGKLLLYHGWADPQVPAAATVDYFNAVLKTTGSQARGASIELYMEPGVSHCFGGEGPDMFDAVGALDGWIQTGHPPRIVASHASDTAIDRTRPLCPYPQIAQYTGTGSLDDAANFRCAQTPSRSPGTSGPPAERTK